MSLRLPRAVEVRLLLLLRIAVLVCALACSIDFPSPDVALGFPLLFTPPSIIGAGSVSPLFIVRLAAREGKLFLARLLFDKMPVN